MKEILELSGTELVLLSGRSKEDLDRWLDDFPAHLSAEHGSWIKEKDSDKWIRLKPLSGDWKNSILPVLEIYTDRLPESRIIEKDFSLHWIYYKSNSERSALIAKELTDHLISITANLDIQICHGNKIIEISNSGMNKGDLATHWINNCKCDFLLAVGEDRTDEILYQALPENAYSIKIGKTRTDLRYDPEFKSIRMTIKDLLIVSNRLPVYLRYSRKKTDY
jgi:trehalose 6-phosphate synthase/phosphatase